MHGAGIRFALLGWCLVPSHLRPRIHSVRYFRHAISLDEHRAKFKANYYHLRNPEDQKGTKLGEMPRSNQRHPHYRKLSSPSCHHKDSSSYEEEHSDTHAHTETDVLEVWFAGCHCGNFLLVLT
jgi:hypothetical protein